MAQVEEPPHIDRAQSFNRAAAVASCDSACCAPLQNPPAVHAVERKSARKGQKSEATAGNTEVGPNALHSFDPTHSGGGPAQLVDKIVNFVWTSEGISWLETNMPIDYKIFHKGAIAGSPVARRYSGQSTDLGECRPAGR